MSELKIKLYPHTKVYGATLSTVSELNVGGKPVSLHLVAEYGDGEPPPIKLTELMAALESPVRIAVYEVIFAMSSTTRG